MEPDFFVVVWGIQTWYFLNVSANGENFCLTSNILSFLLVLSFLEKVLDLCPMPTFLRLGVIDDFDLNFLVFGDNLQEMLF